MATPNGETVLCPACDGTGGLTKGRPGNGATDPALTCPACGGTGRKRPVPRVAGAGLYSIRLRTPGGVHCWVGHHDNVFVGPVRLARKFNLPADAECYMQSHGPFDGFCYEVVPISDEPAMA